MNGPADDGVLGMQQELVTKFGAKVGRRGPDGRWGDLTDAAVRNARARLGLDTSGANADLADPAFLDALKKYEPDTKRSGAPGVQPAPTDEPHSGELAGAGTQIEGTWYRGSHDRMGKPLPANAVAADPRVPYGTVIKFTDGSTHRIVDTGGDFYYTLDPRTGVPRRIDFHGGGDGRPTKFIAGLYHPDGKTPYTADEVKGWLDRPVPEADRHPRPVLGVNTTYKVFRNMRNWWV